MKLNAQAARSEASPKNAPLAFPAAWLVRDGEKNTGFLPGRLSF